MEENFKVRTICDYDDIELKKLIPQNKIRWLTEKRARELCNAGVVVLLEVRRCTNDRTKANT